MTLRFSILIYATTAAVGTLAIEVITGPTIQEGPHNHTDSQYECGRRQNVTGISERIINGTEASIKRWPWMVGIYDSCDNLVCGGSLINKEYVVTAAHCFRNQDAETFYVRLGTERRFNFSCCNETHQYSNEQNKKANEKNENSDLYEKDISSYEASETQGVCVEIESICTPIQETCGIFMKDIAVVKLKRSVTFTDYIQPICLPENCADFPANFTAHIAGWGYSYDSSIEYEGDEYSSESEDETCEEKNEEAMDENSDDLSSAISNIPELPKCVIPTFGLPENLRQRKVDVLDQGQCTDQMNCTVPDYIVCVNGGPCHGDSGGPLMYEESGRWFLAGVVSDGPENCTHPPTPTHFVKVSHFVNSLISPAIKSGSGSSRKFMCATEEARKNCVEDFYKSHNQTIGNSSQVDALSGYKRRLSRQVRQTSRANQISKAPGSRKAWP
uniref:Putative serine protease n=1 Tax=Ixodes ricinus TaxID=34613 RepID=A0A6B0VDY2_IXORI